MEHRVMLSKSRFQKIAYCRILFINTLFFETGYHVSKAGLKYVAQAGLELLVILSLPPKCWECRYV